MHAPVVFVPPCIPKHAALIRGAGSDTAFTARQISRRDTGIYHQAPPHKARTLTVILDANRVPPTQDYARSMQAPDHL